MSIVSHYGVSITNDSDPGLAGELAVQLDRWHLRSLPGMRQLSVRCVRTAYPAVVVSMAAPRAVKRAAKLVSRAAGLPVNWSLSLSRRRTIEFGVHLGETVSVCAIRAGWGILAWAASQEPDFSQWEWIVGETPGIPAPPVEHQPDAAGAPMGNPSLQADRPETAESAPQEEVDDMAPETPAEPPFPARAPEQAAVPRTVFSQQVQPLKKTHALRQQRPVVEPPKPAPKNPRRG